MRNPFSNNQQFELGTRVIGFSTIGLFIIAGFAILFIPEYYANLVTLMFIWGIFAIGFNLCFGYTNLPSFGHAAFFGIGTYAFAITFTKVINSVIIALLAAIIISIVYAIIVGRISVRGRGIYFALLTFAFAQSLYELIVRVPNITGGSNGIFISDLIIAGINLNNYKTSYYVSLLTLGIVLLFGYQLINSPFGDVMKGINDNEDRMEAIGYNTIRIKIVVFIISGVIGALAGILYLINNQFASPGIANYTTSIEVIIMTVIGGAGSVVGPVIGAILLLTLEELVSGISNLGTIIIGLVFIAIILFFRGGITTALRDYLDP